MALYSVCDVTTHFMLTNVCFANDIWSYLSGPNPPVASSKTSLLLISSMNNTILNITAFLFFVEFRSKKTLLVFSVHTLTGKASSHA